MVMMLALMPVVCFAGKNSDAVRQEKLLELISDYSDEDGFDIVQIGSLGTSVIKALVRTAASMDDDPDILDALKVIRGIRKIAVVEYENCEEEVRRGFDRRLGRLLAGCDMLLEAKDGDDVMRMYGVIDDKSDDVRDFILYSSTDCTLVCLFGTISLDAVARLVE